MNTFVLFGAGVYAKKYTALLEYLNMDFSCFTDNDPSKWGTMLYGRPVISPTELCYMQECKIIISCTHEAVIRKQLLNMGLGDNIIGLDELYAICECRMSDGCYVCTKTNRSRTILVDIYEGIGWGGTELWAASLAYGLQNIGENIILLGGTEQPLLEEKYELMTERVNGKNTIAQMVEKIEKSLPCVLINNFAGCAFMAAIIVKRKYPDWVKIVSVVHSDSKSVFDAYMMLSKYIDRIFCVGNQIREHMQEIYSFDYNCYYFKEQPVETDVLWIKRWNRTDTLRIGYAARLVKQAKRVDLIVDLLDAMERKKKDYVLQIAGEGECIELLENYVRKNNLQNRVHLLGRLPKSKMADFWKNQDVFINVSEYEGTSLAMLEAMSYGCVPVVTDVSGSREFIVHRENGYICDVGDIKAIADCIAELADNRNLLQVYGEKSCEIIRERCNPENYIKYWEEEVLGDL